MFIGHLMKSLIILIFASFVSFAYAFQSDCIDEQSQSKSASIVGSARQLETDDLLYCEYFYPQEDSEKVIVEYRDLNQQVLVRKVLDYSSGDTQPSVYQEDFRHGELRKVEFTAKDRLSVRYRKANAEKVKEAELPLGENTVIDAGFDYAVRKHWQELMANESVKINFLSPVHLRTIRLTISLSDKSCGQRSDETCLSIRPSNPILNWLVKPLILVYNNDTQRLVSFEGSVNITSEVGETLSAKIIYHYP